MISKEIVCSNKMSVLTKTKEYTCPVCKSIIKNNTSNITRHGQTLKHQSALNKTERNYKQTSTDPTFVNKKLKTQEYRNKIKNDLGDEQYKKLQAQKKREYRAKIKAKKEEEILSKVNMKEVKENLDDMKHSEMTTIEKKAKEAKLILDEVKFLSNENKADVIEKIVKAGKRSVKPKTVETNLDRIKNIYKGMFNKTWDFISYEWLKDIDSVVDYVKNKYTTSEKTRSNQYVSVAGILKFLPEYKEEYGIYSKLGSHIQDKIDETSKDNTLTRKQSQWLKWDEIQGVWDKLGDDNGGNTFLRALYAIYCFMPPRRVLDYQLMKIVRKDKLNETKLKKLDKKFNYLFINKNKMPTSFTIFNYKEGPRRKYSKQNKNYGEYTLDPLPDNLKDVLYDYILDEDLKGNDFLFGLESNHAKAYSENAFSGLVSKNLFETFADVHLTINSLRHSYASWYLDSLKSLKQKENLAFAMGTSVFELQKSYYKIELTPDYEESNDDDGGDSDAGDVPKKKSKKK